MERREDLIVGGREEDFASDQVHHLHRDEDLTGAVQALTHDQGQVGVHVLEAITKVPAL